MYKENLFQLIRKEDVIIWTGAGMSTYAGYPSGHQLSEILIERLTSKEKECINLNLPLPELAEEFYRVKGNNRNALIRILNETFLDKNPTTNEFHKTLSKIPHFKTIITTNYDTLFEDAFTKEKCQAIVSSKRIPYLDKTKTQIFKVHGDLTEPDSIIITKSDYVNFFKDGDENEVFWTVIKERLSTNNVLFLGYNIEDYNVSAIFERITEALGNNRKECFLVAPNLPIHKTNSLITKGIHYIDSTAEVLISELIEDLKENIISDFENCTTSAETFRLFLNNLGLKTELVSEQKSFKVKTINGIDGKVEGCLNLTLKNDEEFIKEFKKFANGEKFGLLKIPSDKLIHADIRYGGLKFPNNEQIIEFQLKSKPRVSTTVDIVFDNGFELTNLLLKLFSSKNLIELQVESDSAVLTIKVISNIAKMMNLNIDYKHKDICKNVKNEIEFYTLLSNLAQGNHFTVHEKSGIKLSASLSGIGSLVEHADYFLKYFIKLKTIEQYFNIRFKNFSYNEINDTTVEDAEILISVIENKTIEYDWDDTLNMTLEENFTDDAIAQFIEAETKNSPLASFHQEAEVIKIHGHEINIGYKKAEFQDIYVTNLESLIKRQDNIVRIKSRTKKINISYLKERMGD